MKGFLNIIYFNEILLLMWGCCCRFWMLIDIFFSVFVFYLIRRKIEKESGRKEREGDSKGER